MRIIGLGKNNRLIVELQQHDLKLITGENREFEVDETIDISSMLSVLHQLSRKKDRYVPILLELSQVLETF